ncbi:Eukaryotic translation initiation factor 3 subunit J [Frankliniella fusca]|uniref:Eukaryotic translation initiation factor 3 subunit J n=1 Tax=Frankliniella fusca TaxID=407009 RepID=A0AAE1GXT7_9NEOP|nr:Eukaryotic translation initiation factor 3 subunit J [Frankliniella fusca]
MSDWDADDYVAPEPATTVVKAATINKWEGEDEEEDVKDNWEDEEEEEKKDSEKPPEPATSAASKKPKNNLAEKIQLREEKERQLREERAAAQTLKNLTPAERQAEKLRQQKLQEESELELVKATYGFEETTCAGIDSANPSSKEEFDQLREAINNKVQEFSKAEPFVDFVTELVQNMVVNLPATDLKKISANLATLATEKAKMDKAAAGKKKAGKFKGAKLKMDDRNLTSEIEYDDLDDFM